jgi:putative lipoic acid-binding regulatory protein
MAQENNACKLKLNYPCQWVYKVIGTNQGELRQAIMEIITDTPSEISFSNNSSSGKYLCLNLKITVQSEEERNSIYLGLKAHPQVKIVL